MANSAWSGNTAGLASATSAGLVGTGAQTFGGVKTLQAGANIASQQTGVAIASPNVGYLYTVQNLGVTIAASGSDTNGITFTLPVIGCWDVFGSAAVQAGLAFTPSGNARTLICISTASQTLQTPLMQTQLSSVINGGSTFNCSPMSRINCTSTSTNYYLVFRVDGYSAQTGCTVDYRLYARLVG